MRYLPILLLLFAACQDVEEPNVDLRIFYSVGDCMPVQPPNSLQNNTLFTGMLKVTKYRFCAGGCSDPITSLRVYNGVLRMSLEPADYVLMMDESHVQSQFFTVKADSVSAGPVFFRKCTSY